MKKISLLLLVTLVMALAGCSNDDKENTYVLTLPQYDVPTLYMGDLDKPVKKWDSYGMTNYQTLLIDQSGKFYLDCISTKEYGFGSDGFAFTNATLGNYSAVTRKGVSNGTYIVAGASGYNDVSIRFGNKNITAAAKYAFHTVHGLYVTNSLYAYGSMKDGAGFFGKDEIFGANDKLTLTIYTLDKSRHVEVDLAQGTNLLAEWKWVDLTPLGQTDGLCFALNTTKVNASGAMTPLYFCLDGITIAGE